MADVDRSRLAFWWCVLTPIVVISATVGVGQALSAKWREEDRRDRQVASAPLDPTMRAVPVARPGYNQAVIVHLTDAAGNLRADWVHIQIRAVDRWQKGGFNLQKLRQPEGPDNDELWPVTRNEYRYIPIEGARFYAEDRRMNVYLAQAPGKTQPDTRFAVEEP